MTDQTTIANLALQKLGEEGSLSSLSDDRSAARAILTAWDSARRATLRNGKFNFSIFRRELTAQTPSSPTWSSPYPFSNRFPLTAGTLRLVEIIEPASIVEHYQLERGAILADTDGPVWVRVVEDVPDPTLWDELFAEAIAWRIAWQIADAVTGDRARKSDCWTGFRMAISAAAATDAREDPPIDYLDSSWITARNL